jgi:hypothetical protein
VNSVFKLFGVFIFISSAGQRPGLGRSEEKIQQGAAINMIVLLYRERLTAKSIKMELKAMNNLVTQNHF